MITRATLGISMGIAGIVLMACYVYKRKRYSKTLRGYKKFTTCISRIVEHEEIRKYILQQMQLAEECLAVGDIENCIEHLGNAIVSSNEPLSLVQALKETLQAPVFELLLTSLEIAAPHKLKPTNPNKCYR